MEPELLELLRFDPSPFQATTHSLPRLISGEPVHRVVDPLIHRADVYAFHPADLAAKFDPVPQCENTGARFFFTPCKRLKGGGIRCNRLVGGGSWVAQHIFDIKNGAGVSVGEHRTLVFKNGKGGEKEKTKWLMDEYRCDPYPQEALVGGSEMVLCKIQFSKPPAKKRPPPDHPSPKKMAVHQIDPSMEMDEVGDGNLDRFVCTMDELLGDCGGEDVDEAAIDQYVTTLEDALCGAREEEAKPEQQLPPAPPPSPVEPNEAENIDIDQFATTLVDALRRAQEEEVEPEQQLPILTSDESSIEAENEFNELLARYKPRMIFRPDQLDGHNDFISYA